MAWINEHYGIGYPAMLLFGAAMCLVCMTVVVLAKSGPAQRRVREEPVDL